MFKKDKIFIGNKNHIDNYGILYNQDKDLQDKMYLNFSDFVDSLGVYFNIFQIETTTELNNKTYMILKKYFRNKKTRIL